MALFENIKLIESQYLYRFQREFKEQRFHGSINLEAMKKGTDQFFIELPTEGKYTVMMTHWSENSIGQIIWNGNIYTSMDKADKKLGSFSSNITHIGLSGHFKINDKNYEILPSIKGGHLIKTVDHLEFQQTDISETSHIREEQLHVTNNELKIDFNASNKAQSNLEFIDVMVLYSEFIVDPELGGTMSVNQVRAHANQAVADANTVFENSEVNVAFTMVHIGQSPSDMPFFQDDFVKPRI